MAAVRVPPSACSTSQSITIVFSPSAFVSMMARRLRPTRREISWVRPPTRPFTDSRSIRSLVERGNMAYSAVTHPVPLPVSQRGTPFVKLAVQRTRVLPNEMSALPSAWRLQPRSIVTGRSWSAWRPSARMRRGAGLSVMGSPIGGWMRCTVPSGADDGDGARRERLDVPHLGAEEACGEGAEDDLVVARRLEAVHGRGLRRALDAVRHEGAVDVGCRLLRARDEPHIRPHDELDRGRHERVGGAAQHEGVDVGLDERVEVLPREAEQLGTARDARLAELDEARARAAGELQSVGGGEGV